MTDFETHEIGTARRIVVLEAENEALQAEARAARVQGMRFIEDMHQRAWARESEAGNHDNAHWHRGVAEHIAALIAATKAAAAALEKGQADD